MRKTEGGGTVHTLQISMLGEFSLRAGENSISDSDNRTRKIWTLLAYLICQRGQPVSQRRLIELLWGDEPASSNPENALRITFHRARNLLNQLWPTAGRELILYKDTGYCWNGQVPAELDFEEFDRLCSLKNEDPAQRLEACLRALALYRGDFLEKQASDIWVIPISTHFHNLYVNTALEAVELLSAVGRRREAADICRKAVAAEPYHELLHQHWMRQLAALGDTKAAASVYDSLSRRLFNDFGIRPDAQTQAVYRTAVHAPGDAVLPMDRVLEQLTEPEGAVGAMQCDYDHFKILCFAESRAMERSGTVTHVVLLSLTPEDEKPLSKRSLNRIMEQLGQQIRVNLRRGDTFSRCSVSQYVLMLPRANYENSCMVCRRVLGAFRRAHPHVAANIHYMVQPLTPTVRVP